MNSDAVRLRNARKRAKLRQHKRGEQFAHVFCDAEAIHCTRWSQGWTQGSLPYLCDSRLCFECTAHPKNSPMRSFLKCNYPLTISRQRVIISDGEPTVLIKELVTEVRHEIEVAPHREDGITYRFTIAVTLGGQRRVKQWLETTGVEAVSADVIAVL